MFSHNLEHFEDLPDWHMANFKVFHVMWTLHVIMHHAFSSASKSLDGIHLSLL